MSAVPVFVSILPDGRIAGVERTVSGAQQALRDAKYHGRPHITLPDPSPDVRNNPAVAPVVDGLLRLGFTKAISERSAMQYTVEDAFEIILPYLKMAGTTTAQILKDLDLPPATMTDPHAFVDGLLGKNYKTSKSGMTPSSPWSATSPADVVGLSLMPANRIFHFLTQSATKSLSDTVSREAQAMADHVEALAEAQELAGVHPSGRRIGKYFTTCASSTQACRATCLDLAGNSPTEWYKVLRKAALTLALAQEPEAFMRLLAEACHRHFHAPRSKMAKFVRLNVFSDVPWEILAPWLFHLGQGPNRGFYDYTKIPDRYRTDGFPSHYDLTLSYAGSNEATVIKALHAPPEYAMRTAVVFLSHALKNGKWAPVTIRPAQSRAALPHERMGKEAFKAAMSAMKQRLKAFGSADIHEPIPLGSEMWGVPVVNGDAHDVRPFDPPGPYARQIPKSKYQTCVVGLAFKAPNVGGWHAKSKAWTALSEEARNESAPHPAFIYPAYYVSGTSRAGGRSGTGFLVAAVTPQQEPIDGDAK